MGYNANNDYRTSKGNIAPDFHWSGTDDAYNAREQLKRKVESDYSPARVVRPATRKYNCHAYGHANRHAWFNEIKRFIEDDYYPFTPGRLQVGDIVVYVKDNAITHSAKIISLSGNSISKLRSKWGAWPEVEHGETNVPSIYGSIVYYLRKRQNLLEENPQFIEEEGMERISDLIESLITEDREFELMLANTPEMAISIVKSFPEVTELVLYGDDTIDLISKAIAEQELSVDKSLPLLIVLADIATEKSKVTLVEAANKVSFAKAKDLSFGEIALSQYLSQFSEKSIEHTAKEAKSNLEALSKGKKGK